MKTFILSRNLILAIVILVFSSGINIPIYAQNKPFRIEIKYTTDATVHASFPGSSYTIKWRKAGTTDDYKTKTVNQSPTPLSSIFPSTGNFEVNITGITSFRIAGNVNSIITKVISWGDIKWTSMSKMFQRSGLKDFPSNIDPPDLSQCTNMSWMFAEATNFEGDISNWNTSNVTNMSWMFYGAEKFNQDLKTNGKQWDVSQVTNMYAMFRGAEKFNGDISNWNTSNVTNMRWMFDRAEKFNQDLKTNGKQWDVSQVTNMYAMFWGTKAFNGDISNWNTGNVIDMKYMFSTTKSFNGDISNWNTRNVTSMRWMFYRAEKFDQPLDKWDISTVTDMAKMLDNCGLSVANFDKTIIAWNNNYKNKKGITIGVAGMKYCKAKSEIDQMKARGWKFVGNINKECKSTPTQPQPAIAIYKEVKSSTTKIDSGQEFVLGTFTSDKILPSMTFTVENTGKGTLENIEASASTNNGLSHNITSLKSELNDKETSSFTLDFKAVTEQPKYGGEMKYDIKITSNAKNQPNFVFSIKWKVPIPDIEVYNAVTPNNDGVHDFLIINNIRFYPNNTVIIFNRWGDVVYEQKGYDNKTKVFTGVSNKSAGYILDTGNYYYAIDKGDGSAQKTGFLFLKKEN